MNAGRGCAAVAVAGILSASILAASAAAQNAVSRPAGFVRLAIGTNASLLASLPFEPSGESLDEIVGEQMVPGDRIYKWDNLGPGYVQAVRTEARERRWVTLTNEWGAGELTLAPGEGFWLVSPTPQDVYLSGEVVLDTERAIAIVPGLTSIGYPYSTSAEFTNTALHGDPALTDLQVTGPVPDTNAAPGRFVAGAGYWVRNLAPESVVWIETRPYANPFPMNDAPPQIMGVDVAESGQAARLSIGCRGAADERLDIYYQDMDPDGRFDTTRGWLPAALDVPALGASVIAWEDRGGRNRPPPDEVAGRYYLVGSTVPDEDADGFSSARERFLYGTDPGDPDSIPSPDADEGVHAAAGLASSDFDLVAGEDARGVMLSRIIYVDAVNGSDAFPGRIPVVDSLSGDGPKKSIREGLAAVAAGGDVVIRSGKYDESIDIHGKDVKVRIHGNVSISKRSRRGSRAGRGDQ